MPGNVDLPRPSRLVVDEYGEFSAVDVPLEDLTPAERQAYVEAIHEHIERTLKAAIAEFDKCDAIDGYAPARFGPLKGVGRFIEAL